MMRKLAPAIAIPITVLALAGCATESNDNGGSSTSASSSSASPAPSGAGTETPETGGEATGSAGSDTLKDIAAVPEAAKQGKWTDAGVITTDTSLTDPTAVELNTFIDLAKNGGTIIIAVPEDNGSPGYVMEASMQEDNYFTKYITQEGISFTSGNGTQWCVTDVLETGSPSTEDWACTAGRPQGGNEFEQIAGFGWLPLSPASILGGNAINIQATEGTVESNGTDTRVTYDVKGDKIIVTYSPSNGWVFAEQPGNGEPFSYIYSSDVPEFPALPALPADDIDITNSSAAPQPNEE